MLKFVFALFYFSLTVAQAADLDTNYVTFNVSERNMELSHNESSAATNFKSINATYSIPVFSLKAGLEKEIFENQPLSFTLGGSYGLMYGKKKKDFLATDTQISDKVSGTFYTLGGTANANFMWQKMRSQVFGGLNIVKSDTKYRVTSGLFSSDASQTNLDYKEDGTQSFLTAGVRFFDNKLGLFSIISLEYEVTSTFTNNLTASKVDGASVLISNPATIEHKPLVINLGFGITF
ncbi:hypothetical protein SHI21_10130 [Bacteriovorax sp. PP10]|uniref:Outer membrane protein beta-barrel domain-containing protein n=1 Tax=Bacteriovorax antarcticus TaxID=3088717 RepID=A0ABU5VW35_9BACT|nr:hypothetical protein [Bacteriovorax sp. PP10]MEA9356564.1 hypothetical protein [Bacteriovorax sp. PP10]